MNAQLSPTGPRAEPIRRHAYSDRRSGLRPIPLGLSIGVTGALFAAYLLAPQAMIERFTPFSPIKVKQIPLPTPPKPAPQPREASPQSKTTIVVPRPPLAPPLPGNPPIGTTDRGADNPFTTGPVGHTSTLDPPVLTKLPVAPVLTQVSIDPRFADRFQPDYPPAMLRLEREGIARVRVLVGPDGRVRDVVDAGSSTTAFFDATRKHALRAWRFKPATRDGAPFESWHVMTVTFKLTG
ncbi:energy transducer TonB [Flavisphingopyxis soli]|nr:energy transducer TonB [Sphingorhabdus soli]